MKDIFLTRSGHPTENHIIHTSGDATQLLYGAPDFEAVFERKEKGIIGFLYTAKDDVGIEFHYISKGSIELREGDERITICAGDTWTHQAISGNIMFRIVEDLEYIGVHTKPCYDSYEEEHKLMKETLANLQAVDGDTLNHCVRVKSLCMGICYYMDIDLDCLTDLYFAASFHDVGKAKIPLEILLKPANLTSEEFEIMKTHSLYTYEMIRESCGENVARMAFEHHEKLDGTGYPKGLRGDEISMPARIICVADAYDAMTVTRPYRTALSSADAIAELRYCCHTQFDPLVVDALETYLRENVKSETLLNCPLSSAPIVNLG